MTWTYEEMTEFTSDQRAILPIICPAWNCGSKAFQKGSEGAGAWNYRCERGHILWQDATGRVEIVGFQPRGTEKVYGEPKETHA